MNVKKPVFLFLALLLPIAVFLFLKFFGKNEFRVTPLFEKEIAAPADCSGIDFTAPYHIRDAALDQVKGKDDSLTLIIFKNTATEHEVGIQLKRVLKEFPRDPVSVIQLASDTLHTIAANNPVRQLNIDDHEFTRLYRCVFLLANDHDAVIIDSKNRVAGQYTLSDREDTDRLILELKILLRKY